MDPEKQKALERSKQLFRKVFFQAITRYEESLREDPDNPIRARWTKEEVMSLCKWPYPKDWRPLREALETKIGLIMLLHGARGKRGDKVCPWTFATCPKDREWCVVHAVRCQVGGMKRTARITALAIAPPSPEELEEKSLHALEEGSGSRINQVLEDQGIKLNKVLKTLQDVKQDLLDRETMKLLEKFGD